MSYLRKNNYLINSLDHSDARLSDDLERKMSMSFQDDELSLKERENKREYGLRDFAHHYDVLRNYARRSLQTLALFGAVGFSASYLQSSLVWNPFQRSENARSSGRTTEFHSAPFNIPFGKDFPPSDCVVPEKTEIGFYEIREFLGKN